MTVTSYFSTPIKDDLELMKMTVLSNCRIFIVYFNPISFISGP